MNKKEFLSGWLSDDSNLDDLDQENLDSEEMHELLDQMLENLDTALGEIPDDVDDETLDQMLNDMLQGVLFDAEEDMDDVPMDELLQQAEEYRDKFLQLAEDLDAPLSDRLQLSRWMMEKAQTEPSAELLRLYCEIIMDNGFLLDQKRDRVDHVAALNYLLVAHASAYLYVDLIQRHRISTEFPELLAEIKEQGLHQAEGDTSQGDWIAEEYTKIFGGEKDRKALRGKIDSLLRTIYGCAPLKKIEPLFLYQALSQDEISFADDISEEDWKNLWQYREYPMKSEQEIANCAAQMEFYTALHDAYAMKEDCEVDLMMCTFLFSVLSNLAHYYEEFGAADDMFNEDDCGEGFFFDEDDDDDDDDDEDDYDEEGEEDYRYVKLPMPIEDIVERSMFTCFENEHNVFRKGGKCEWISAFEDPKYEVAEEILTNYLAEHADELSDYFLDADDEAVIALCNQILKDVKLPKSCPKGKKAKRIYLEAINDILMDNTDVSAKICLLRAGQFLITGKFQITEQD